MTEQEWLEAYVRLTLRIGRQATDGTSVLVDYRGPDAWRDEVAAEEPPPPGRLAQDADELLDAVPGDPGRAAFLAAHARSLRAVARRLAGEDLPLRDYARACLGIEADWVPESAFEEAHARLDAALPAGGGTVADRLHAWQAAHRLPAAEVDRLPGLVRRAVAEARRRTQAVVALPEDEEVDCRLVGGVGFLAAGAHHGGTRSTIYVNREVPFNLADLLYVVTHEGHPGHIAESVLKEARLVPRPGGHDQQARFLVTPQFVVSEGLGLHAQGIAFPGDEAQAWLTDTVLAAMGIPPDGSDFAAVHAARNALLAAWANAALLLADGHRSEDAAAYLARWALLDDTEVAAAMATLTLRFAEPYIFCYSHGWSLVGAFLDRHPADGARRLLTEQLLPDDLRP